MVPLWYKNQTRFTRVIGLCSAVQEADVDTAKMDDVKQSCDHHSPYSDNQSHHNVDEEQQVRQQEETLPEKRFICL